MFPFSSVSHHFSRKWPPGHTWCKPNAPMSTWGRGSWQLRWPPNTVTGLLGTVVGRKSPRTHRKNMGMNYYHELWFNASWMGQTNGDLMGWLWNPVLEKTHQVYEKCWFKPTPSTNCGNGGGYHGDMMGLIHVRPHSYVCCLFAQLE